MGTKLNRLTSTGRCVATGTDSPFGSPRPRAEVAVHLETVGQGGDAPAPARCPRRPSRAGPRPCPALELPPGSQRAPPGDRKGPGPAEETAPPGLGPVGEGPTWSQCGPQPAGISLPERGLCSLSPFGLPCFLTQSSFSPGPSLGSCSGGKEQGQYGAFSFSPSRLGNMSSLDTCLGGGDAGPCSCQTAPIPGALLHSCAFPWRLCCDIHIPGPWSWEPAVVPGVEREEPAWPPPGVSGVVLVLRLLHQLLTSVSHGS